MMAKDKQDKNEVQLVGKSETPTSVDVTDSLKKTFDASAWSAGTVKFSKSVYPIESLRLGTTTAIDSETDPYLSSSLQAIGRYWVCEAVEGDLSAGDYVVVSPLDSVPSEGLPARAKIKP